MTHHFSMRSYGTGNTAAEVEASALNRARGLSGHEHLRISESYLLREIRDLADEDDNQMRFEIKQAAERGDTLWARIYVRSYGPETRPVVDLNLVLEEGLNAIDDWETSKRGSMAEFEAGITVTEALATLHDALSHGGNLPDAWARATGTGRSAQQDARDALDAAWKDVERNV